MSKINQNIFVSAEIQRYNRTIMEAQYTYGMSQEELRLVDAKEKQLQHYVRQLREQRLILRNQQNIATLRDWIRIEFLLLQLEPHVSMKYSGLIKSLATTSETVRKKITLACIEHVYEETFYY